MSTAANLVETKLREAGDKNARTAVCGVPGRFPAVFVWRREPAGDRRRSQADPPRSCTPDRGHNTIIDVTLDGEQAKAMIVDWQNEPIKGNLLHVDLEAHRHG